MTCLTMRCCRVSDFLYPKTQYVYTACPIFIFEDFFSDISVFRLVLGSPTVAGGAFLLVRALAAHNGPPLTT